MDWTRNQKFGTRIPKNFPIALMVLALLLGATPTLAFVEQNWECQESQSHAECLKDGGLKSIFIFEEIVPADARLIEEFDVQIPKEKPFPKIFITSRGGSMRAAMKIGRILRSRNAHIEGRDLFFPDRPAMCSSACVTLVAGAIDRQFDQIGVHRPYISSRDKACRSTRTDLSDADLEEDLKYFTEMGMPAKLFEYLKNTPSKLMTEFYYDPETDPDEQMIVQFGFRMHPTAQDAPKMFYTNGEPRFTTSIDLMERGVREGNAEAANGLGNYYEELSEKHPRQIETAIKWYEKAGELGYYSAYHNLGVMFSNGTHVKKDKKRAASYYRQAAELGSSGSQNNLGWAYYKGEGVPRNYGLAIYWITRSVEQGEPFAYSSLGEMRLYAHGFPPDDVEAYKWLKLADGSLPSGKALDDNTALLKILQKRMSIDEIERAKLMANAWHPLKPTYTFMDNKCNT